MDGTVFLHQIGATTLPKCTAPQCHQSHFVKQVATFLIGYSLSYFLFLDGLLFFPHKRPKKRSKRTPLGYNWNRYSLEIGNLGIAK
jgi:hypothetical protein